MEDLQDSCIYMGIHIWMSSLKTYRLKDRLKAGVQTVPPADIPAVE
jgi:hypothetical protein